MRVVCQWIFRCGSDCNASGRSGLHQDRLTSLLQLAKGDRQRAAQTLRFFTWVYANGDALANQAKFIPLPDKVQANAFREISTVVGSDGELIGIDALRVLID